MEASGKVFNREVNKVKKDKKDNNDNGKVVAESEAELEPRRVGIERELEVIRVGPNPRILTCRYKELASERTCKVGVRAVANFVRGMRFKMVEPIDELEYAGVWRYEGALPRLKGRW
jgi:cellobiose-specific phosphotransferase system component IIB